MAQGDLLLFDEFSETSLGGDHNLRAAGNVIKVALITTLPVVTQTTPTLADFTEVTGTGYTAGGVDIQVSQVLTQVSGSTYKYDSSVNPQWNQDGAGPTNIMAALIYNSTTSDKAIGFVNMTTDDVTPVSLQAGNVSINWNASGIFLHG